MALQSARPSFGLDDHVNGRTISKTRVSSDDGLGFYILTWRKSSLIGVS